MGAYSKIPRVFLLVLAGLLTLGGAAAGQVQVGDDILLNLNGNLAAGYSASYGDGFPSGHGFTFGGNADLSGSYYDPRFLSFKVNPYVNQSRQNSNFQSITSSSGVNASAAIFSGSQFPGWVNFSQNFNGTGTYAVPGLPDYVAHGNSRSFGVGWSEVKTNWPLVSLSYQHGSSDYSLFGTNASSSAHFNSFNTNVSDVLAGFHLNGNFHYGKSNSEFPQVISTEFPQKFDTDNTSYSLGASHAIPLGGTFSTNFSQSDYSFASASARDSGTVRSVEGFVGIRPATKLTLDLNAFYTDNFLGTLEQTILNRGGGVIIPTPGSSSFSYTVAGNAVYSVSNSLRLIGRADHRTQNYEQGSYSSNSLGGVVSYFRYLWGGRVNLTQTVSETRLDYKNESSLGITSSVGYARSFGKWNTMANFSFFQSQQTLLVNYTNSGYSYSGTLGRRLWWKAYFNAGANGAKSLYNNQSNSGYYNQTYTAALTAAKVGASASYTKSNGNGLLTGTGVVPSPVPGPIIPLPMLLYGGEAYSYSLSGNPLRRLSLTATYTRAHSNTSGPTESTSEKGELANVYLQYAFRKVYFNAGYSRIFQGFSGSGAKPIAANSYYAGISRWFNFF